MLSAFALWPLVGQIGQRMTVVSMMVGGRWKQCAKGRDWPHCYQSEIHIDRLLSNVLQILENPSGSQKNSRSTRSVRFLAWTMPVCHQVGLDVFNWPACQAQPILRFFFVFGLAGYRRTLWIPLKCLLSISKQNPKAEFVFPRFQTLQSNSKKGKSCDEYSQAFQLSSKSSWKSWEAHPSICKICVALPLVLP